MARRKKRSGSPTSRPPNSQRGDAKGESDATAQVTSADPLSTEDARPTSAPTPAKAILFPQLPSLSRIMSVVMLMFGILAVGILFYQLMIGFFVPLFLAALLVVIFRPVHDWLLRRVGRRKRVAAGLTTALILLLVLIPAGILVSVATTQFTILVSQLNLASMQTAMDRVRGQLGLSLEHPQHFRELDRIIDSLGIGDPSPRNEDLLAQADQLDRAAAIIEFLQADMGQLPTEFATQIAQIKADEALENLSDLSKSLREARDADSPTLTPQMDVDPGSDEFAIGDVDPTAGKPVGIDSLNVMEQLGQSPVKTAASIRSWMHVLLGGAVRSQLRLIANPGEADVSLLIRRARETLQPRFVRLTSATGSIVLQLIFGSLILVVSVYFFLIDGAVMIRTLMRLSPMDDAYEHQLLMEFDRTSRAVVLASALSAIVQGILATLGYWLCGFDQIVLLFFLTSLMALVPFLGAASIWLPCAMWLGFVEQSWVAASILGIYGATLVSSIDNVIKVFVLHGRSQLHPLFALLSVIGGVSVFGPIGILVGPMVVVFLQTLLEILNHELRIDAAAQIEGDSGS
ncbi:MAG: AI-2E family transporter [Planctomycetota bacterium]